MQQETLIAGDTLNFVTSTPGYAASAGWTLKYRLIPRTVGNAPISLTSAAEGDDHRVQVTATTTAGWAVDTYGWSAWVENGSGEKYTVQSGVLQVLPDPRQAAAGTDTRSQARKALDDAKAALAAWSPTTKRYVINGREREFNSTAEIIKLITYWENQVLVEEQLAGRAEKPSRRIFSRI